MGAFGSNTQQLHPGTQGHGESELGQQDTYLGKRCHNQVIAVSGEEREKKHLKIHLNYNSDI